MNPIISTQTELYFARVLAKLIVNMPHTLITQLIYQKKPDPLSIGGMVATDALTQIMGDIFKDAVKPEGLALGATEFLAELPGGVITGFSTPQNTLLSVGNGFLRAGISWSLNPSTASPVSKLYLQNNDYQTRQKAQLEMQRANQTIENAKLQLELKRKFIEEELKITENQHKNTLSLLKESFDINVHELTTSQNIELEQLNMLHQKRIDAEKQHYDNELRKIQAGFLSNANPVAETAAVISLCVFGLGCFYKGINELFDKKNGKGAFLATLGGASAAAGIALAYGSVFK